MVKSLYTYIIKIYKIYGISYRTYQYPNRTNDVQGFFIDINKVPIEMANSHNIDQCIFTSTDGKQHNGFCHGRVRDDGTVYEYEYGEIRSILKDNEYKYLVKLVIMPEIIYQKIVTTNRNDITERLDEVYETWGNRKLTRYTGAMVRTISTINGREIGSDKVKIIVNALRVEYYMDGHIEKL